MTDVTNRALSPPTNWQDFERISYDIYSRRWQTNDAEMHGRQGQPQAGVDIYGHDRLENNKFVGVQCKGKDQTYNEPLKEAELRQEIEKAKNFIPRLDVFVLATTAPNDARIQQVARTLTEDHRPQGLFEVRVQGWRTLQQWLTDYPNLLTKYYPDIFPPSEILSGIERGFADTRQDNVDIRTQLVDIKGLLTAQAEQPEASDPLATRIIIASRLVDSGIAQGALQALDLILKEEGDKISGRNLFRFKAGVGFAHIALGDLATAARDFRDAYAAAPEWSNARAILAVAELLEGNREAAYSRATEVLAEDPTSYHAAAVVLDTAADDTTIADLEARVPEGLRKRVDILIGLSLRARKSGDATKAEEYARCAVEVGPSDLRALSTLAEVLLEPLTAIEAIGFTRLIPPNLQPRFDEALDLLQRAWGELKGRDDVIRHDHIVANLVTALEVGGREAEAEQVLDQGLEKAPRSPPLLHHYAQRMAIAGDWPAALKAIESIPASEIEPPDAILQAIGHLRTGDADRALSEARALQEKFGSTRFAESAAALRLEAAAVLGFLHEELDATLAISPASIVLRSVAVGLLPEDDPRRRGLVAEIDGLVAKIDTPQDRFHAAEALYAAKQYAKAADLYAGLHGKDADTPALRRHLSALALADHRQEARQLFDSLAGSVKALPQYAEAGAGIYERSGLLTECRKIVEKYLLDTGDLLRRLHWVSLCERLGDPEPVVEWLRTITPEQAGSPRDLMMLALRIDRLLGDPRCLPIAYRALREGYDDPQVHLGYTVGLFLSGRVPRQHIDTPTEVSPDTAVVLTASDGQKLVRVIETEPNPRIERDEVAPDDSLAMRLIGLHVGDEIKIDNFGIEATTYVVSTIQNKYLHAHFRSLERFRTMFPENRAFGSFTIDEGKGDERFKPIFDLVKNRGERAKQIMEFYRSGRLPLAVAANLGGSSGFECWDAVWGDPATRFNVGMGRSEDYQEAHRILSAKRRAVVDPITLYGLVRLKIAEKVRAAFDDLGVVQTTIDLLRRVVLEREHAPGEQQGTLGWDGEHYNMVRLGPDSIQQRITEAQEVVAFAESLTLVPAEAPGEIKDEAKTLFNDLDDAYLDTVLAARGDDRVLLCDDFPFRVLGSEAAGIESVWTQPAVAYAVGRGYSVTLADHFEVVNALVVAGYFFTSIGADNFLFALRKNGWSIDETIRALADLLAHPANNPVPIFNILRNLIRVAWGEKSRSDVFESLFVTVFSAFKKNQPNRDLELLIRVVMVDLHRVLWRNYLVAKKKEVINELLSTTVPAAILLADKIEAIRLVAPEIADVLIGALHKAVGGSSQNPTTQTTPAPHREGKGPGRRARREAARASRRGIRRRRG
jgi:tetratricopeptide (TPR) repeat protein